MSSKSISVWKALAFQIMMMLAIALILPLSATAQLRINQAGKQQNKPLTQAQASSNRQVADSKATEPAKQDPKADSGSPFDAVRGKKEDTSKRDLYSKHYKNDDGSYTALIGAGPIHFEKGGQFYDIDHNITNNSDAVYPYANTTNLFESYFGATAHKGVKNKTPEGEIKEFLNTKMYWEVNGQAVNTQTSSDATVSVQGDKAYYHNLFGNISAEFVTLSGKRKLNYVIPNAQALGSVPANANYLTFTEDVVLPQGWTHTVSNDGIYVKNQSGENIYLYENPISTDETNELTQETNTIFETSLNGNVLTIKTKVKTAWLLSNERLFPVKVDPTTNVYPNSTSHRTGQCFSTGGGYGNMAVGYAGGYYRGFATFDTASILDGSTITSTVLYHNVGSTTGMGTQRGSELRAYLGLPQDQGTFSNIYNAITNATISPNIYQTVYNLGSTGWKNITLGTTANGHLQNRLGVNNFTIGYRPAGTYSGANQYALLYGTPDPGGLGREPYISVTYTEPITDRTLTVSGAYTGASHTNGNHTLTHNSNVTATSGTRTGYNVTGWTGTGSVPATGTGGTANFTITQNSTINWQWQQVGTPNNVAFYNTGGSEQLAFNNSRINTTTPVFRLSHATDPASDYQIEINTAANFTGTSYMQTFTNAYPANTQANFTFTNGFTPSNGTTYYVRARVKGAADVYSAWTNETYSFTYDTSAEIANWFQTTQAQLATATHSGTEANSSGDIIITSGGGGNVITNGSFEPNLSGWTISKPGWYTVASEPYGNTLGTNALNIYNTNPGSYGNFNGDSAGVYQTINMTGVSTVLVDFGYESTNGSNLNVDIEIWISETSQTGLRVGTRIENWRPTQNVTTGNARSIDVSSYGFTGNKLIKIVTYLSISSTDYSERYFYIDNLRTVSQPTGTATSTPIHLASMQDAGVYQNIIWNQTLGGGDLTLKIQQSADGISGWADVAGYNNITASGDGVQTHDISGMTPYAHIRLIGTLNGANVVLHDWSVTTQEPCEALITSVTPEDDTICGNTGTTITAVANDPGHEIRWYASASGGSVLYTGDTFTTPVLTSDTTYYVTAYDGVCESDVRTPVTIEVNEIPASVNVAIGTPANGTAHHINVSWTDIGVYQYQIEYSWNNTQWFVGGFSTSTSYSLNLHDNPDREVFIRVKEHNAPDCYAYADPIYTAADNPGVLTFGTVTGTSVQVIIPAETPVANPAHTTYSLYNETLGLYVQADGSLGATEAFQTKTAWSSTPVTGLDPETEYCFYAKARNQDGDVRYEEPVSFITQNFDSNPPLTTNTGNTNWFAPNGNTTPPTPIAWSSGNGCPSGGGAIGYNANWNNFWGNFVRLPQQDMTGLDSFKMTFDLSNSFTAGRTDSDITFSIWADNGYRSIITEVKVDGTPITLTSNGRIYFDEIRQCVPVEVTFDLNASGYDVIDHSSVFIYINASSAYNNSDPFFFYVDNISVLDANSGLLACVTTGSACEAEIVGVTNNSGCGTITLSAETNGDDVYEVNWYDEDNQLVHIGFTYTVNVIETSTFYVAASNGECESALVPVTATFVPTTAEIEYYETPTSICNPGYVSFYAETNDDGLYTVSWYDAATGGNLLGTGKNLNIYITVTTTVWATAVDGDCESPERQPITVTTNAKTWNGSVDSDWHNASNWTPAGVPTISNCVIIPAVTNSPIISSGNGNARSITMLEGASMLVETGGAITVAQNLVLAEDQITGETLADFTLENDAYLYQPNNTSNNTNVGSITVHRNSTPMFRLDASGWGSPVENQKLYEFSPETVFGRIYEYDETDNVFVNTNITLNSVFVPAKGYSVRAPNGFPTYSGSATPEVFEGVFYGRPNNGDIGIELTKNDLGYNYVSNPYPSPIEADYLFDIPEVDALYFWTHEAPPINGVYAANNYAAYSMGGGVMAAAGGEIPDGIINVGQGFVAKVTGEFQLEFTNSMRNRESEGQFFRMANTEKHRYWLNLSDSEKGYNQILVGYIENATMDLDHKIDAKLFGYSGSSLYSLVGNERLVIQGRSLPFNVADMVPLGFKSAQAGEFFIQIEKTDGLFLEEGQVIYLKDLYTNTTHNLTEDGAYHFVSEAGTFDSRFNIVYQNSTLSAGNPNMTGMDWIAYQDADQIFVKSIGFDIENIEIYDLTGRLLIQEQDINAQSFSVPALFAEQVLIVKVNKTMVKKINYNN